MVDTAKLKELKVLLDDGILTQEEFDAEKKKVLAAPDAPVAAGLPVEQSQTTAQPSQVQVELQPMGPTQKICIFNKPTADTKCGITTNGDAPPVKISALGSEGAAKGAGLQVGDIVVSINGENITSHTHLGALLKAAVGEVKIVLTREPQAPLQPMMQPGMMQPVQAAMGAPQPLVMQHGQSITMNAAGQLVNADGTRVMMDGGGRPWSAIERKILATELDGCYCQMGICCPTWGIFKITSEGEDEYTETGVAHVGVPIIWCTKYRRIPNTNSFKEDQCNETHKANEQGGSVKLSSNHPTACCYEKCG